MVASRLHFAAPLSSVGCSTSLGRSYRILKSTLLLGLRMILSNSREDVFHRVLLKYGGCDHGACEFRVFENRVCEHGGMEHRVRGFSEQLACDFTKRLCAKMIFFVTCSMQLRLQHMWEQGTTSNAKLSSSPESMLPVPTKT